MVKKYKPRSVKSWGQEMQRFTREELRDAQDNCNEGLKLVRTGGPEYLELCNILLAVQTLIHIEGRIRGTL